MPFQDDPAAIRWRLHLRSPADAVYAMLATDAGRARFWAESAEERDGALDFIFPGQLSWRGAILQAEPPHTFAVRYYGGSIATFALADDGRGGTDLTLTDVGVPPEDRAEVIAGWVSVLLSLKAAVDFGVDLRAHDPARDWGAGYAEN